MSGKEETTRLPLGANPVKTDNPPPAREYSNNKRKEAIEEEERKFEINSMHKLLALIVKCEL